MQPSFKVEDRRQHKVYTLDSPKQADTNPKDEASPLTVQIHIPRNYLFSLPRVELHKGEAFTSQELDGFAAVLKVANQLPLEDQVWTHSKIWNCTT